MKHSKAAFVGLFCLLPFTSIAEACKMTSTPYTPYNISQKPEFAGYVDIAKKHLVVEKKINPIDYEFVVFDREPEMIVVAMNKNAPQGMRGSDRKFPSFEVYIDSMSNKIIRITVPR
jgi:hypothetical protein